MIVGPTLNLYRMALILQNMLARPGKKQHTEIYVVSCLNWYYSVLMWS